MPETLKVQINERRCHSAHETHTLPLPVCCPRSKNPRPGSTIAIAYEPQEHHLEVASLKAYIQSYQGGRGEVRAMEAMIQQICQDCADAVGVRVEVTADLVIEPGQKMKLVCSSLPRVKTRAPS